MYYRVGEYQVIAGKEHEFEALVRQLFIDTRSTATDRVQVYLVRSTSDRTSYSIVGTWKTAGQYDNVQTTDVRKTFDAAVQPLPQRPRGGWLFEVVAAEP